MGGDVYWVKARLRVLFNVVTVTGKYLQIPFRW